MKLIYFKRKLVCFVLIFAVLLQSCSVYKKESVTLIEARDSKNKVFILKSNGTKLYLDSVEEIDGSFYGIAKVKKKIVKVPLADNDILSIHLFDLHYNVWDVIAVTGITIIIVSATVYFALYPIED